MKSQIFSLSLVAILSLGLLGCSSRHAVKSELSDASVKLYHDSSYGVKIADAGGKPLDFGPRERRQAMTSLQAELANRSVAIEEDISKVSYLITFGTYSEREKESYASVFPQRRVYAYSTPRGIGTPLGSVVTGRDTHFVETYSGAGAIAFENANRVFVIDVADAKSGELLWRGYTRRGSDRLDTKTIEQEIAKIVKALPLEKKVRSDPESASTRNDPI